jgi:DNA invertase Pin-like site-specific DNA recombinase
VPKAAQYVRMSKDVQDLSIDIQERVIAAHALLHGIEVVRTYIDSGISGMTLRRRKGMQQLLRDVMNPSRGYNTVLVLDVSRWGRYQDVDEGAYYEFHCRKHGVSVQYVQEQFGASNSPLDSLGKQWKRVMAGEYSRELSVKCSAGVARVIALGYAAGQMPCLGYRRQAESADGVVKRLLEAGERKPHLTDRVRWVLGPEPEVEVVRRLFREFVAGSTYTEIANGLAREGVRCYAGKAVSKCRIAILLRSETVRGVFKWGEFTTPVPAIVDQDLWDRAQARINEAIWRRNYGVPKNQLVERLRAALIKWPDLRQHEFTKRGLPHPHTYQKHFRSFPMAYLAAGSTQDFARFEHTLERSRFQIMRQDFMLDLFKLLHASWVFVQLNRHQGTLTVNDIEIKVKLASIRPSHGHGVWYSPEMAKIRAPGRWVLVMRLTQDRRSGIDFFLIPPAVHATFKGTFSAQTLPTLEPYRLATGAALVEKLRRLSN